MVGDGVEVDKRLGQVDEEGVHADDFEGVGQFVPFQDVEEEIGCGEGKKAPAAGD